MAVTFRDIVPAQQPELLASGFQFTEGPVWHPQGFLLFSDIPADTIYRYVPDRGVQRFVNPSNNSNGLTYDRAGRLLACEHSGRRLSRMDESGTMRPLVETYDGKRLNSPNDITVHSSGSIFFTDPPYGIDPDPGELGFNGIYRLDPNGLISLVNDELVRPNGLAFNPDESLLYVADSRARQVRSFTVNPDLSLGWHSLFVDMDVREAGNPDGIKVNTYGHVFVAASTGIWVMETTGEYLGTIEFPELPANLAFGGLGRRFLYATARTSIYRVRVHIPGIVPL